MQFGLESVLMQFAVKRKNGAIFSWIDRRADLVCPNAVWPGFTFSWRTKKTGWRVPTFSFILSLPFSLPHQTIILEAKCILTMIWTRKGTCISPKAVSAYWAIQRSWFARVNELCNLLSKKSREVAAHFRANFWVGVGCFTLCISVEVEPRIAKQYKCQYRCICKNYPGKGMEGGKKVSFCRFFAGQKIASA